MKGVDYSFYKNLKNRQNLPKHDPGMTPISNGYQPISSGYQSGDFFNPSGSIQKMGESNNDAKIYRSQQVPTIIESGGTMFSLGKELYNTTKDLAAANAAKTTALSNYANIQQEINAAAEAGTATAESNYAALGELAKAGGDAAKASAASKAATVAGRGVSALAAAYGTYKSIQDADTYGRSPYSASDFLKASGTSENEINGIKYTTYDGYDKQGADKALRQYNNLGMTSSISSGVAAGSGIGALVGSFIPGGTIVGGILGAGIGALGGAITGWINRGKAKRKMREQQELYSNVVSGYNQQAEAEAANKGIQNQYYQSHFQADEGLNLNSNKPNGRFGALEQVIETNDDGKVVKAYTLPWIPGVHEPRRDDYYGKAGDNVGIAGWKIDEETGLPFTAKVAPLVQAFNSTNDPVTRDILGETMKRELNKQEKTPKNNPSPYDNMYADQGKTPKTMKKYNCGKGLKKYDYGDTPRFSTFAPYAIIPGLAKMAYNYKRYTDTKNSGFIGYDPSVSNRQIQSIFAGYPTNVNVGNQITLANDATKYNLHSIDQAGGLSAGQKAALKGSAYSDYMKQLAAIYAEKNKLQGELMRGKTQLAAQYSDAETQRLMQGRDIYGKSTAQARGAQYSNMDKYGTGAITGLGDIASNISTLQQFLYNIGLYREDLNADKKRVINNLKFT